MMMVDNGYSYGKNLLIAIDQLFSALIGYPCDETLSSLAYRWELAGKRKWVRVLIDGLFFWQKGHCQKAYKSELERAHLPISMRGEEDV